MFDGNDDFDLEDDFLNDIFGIEKENVNIPQKTGRVEGTSHSTGSESSKCEQQSSYQRFVFNPSVNSVCRPSTSLLHNEFREAKDVSSCGSKGSDSIRSTTRKPITPVKSTPKTKRQRKFPGPAGLLPDRENMSFSDAEETLPVTDPENTCDVPVNDLCSQGPCSGSVLQEEPWQQMLADLGSHPPGREVLDMLNIASIKRKGAARLLVGRKVPFLAAVLHHIDISSADPVVVLRDHTGEMHGTLHQDVWEQFGAELTLGSVLVLRNVGVLSTGMSARRHYLNITSNNLATIYSASQGDARVSNLRPLTKTDFMKTIEDWQAMVNQVACNSPGYASPNPQLFNGIQPVASSPSFSLASKPLRNKLQSNVANIRNLAKAFSNNRHPMNPGAPRSHTAVNNSSSSVNNKNNQTFNPVIPTCSRTSFHNRSSIGSNENNHTVNRTPVFESSYEKFVPNSVPSGSNKINEVSNKNLVPNNMTCSFDLQSVADMFLSRDNTQKSQYTTQKNNGKNNFKTDSFENSGDFVNVKPESSTFQPKKPRFSNLTKNNLVENTKQTINLSASNITICSGTVTEDEKSVVASVLDGLDEDSLFSDDF